MSPIYVSTIKCLLISPHKLLHFNKAITGVITKRALKYLYKTNVSRIYI